MTNQIVKIFDYAPTDLDYQRAYEGYRGISWSPEKRAEGWQKSYYDEMDRINTMFNKWLTEENREAMTADLNRYRDGYLKVAYGYLDAQSRVMSQFITGAGGWTARMIRSHRKKNDIVHKRLGEFVAYTNKILPKVVRKYNPYLLLKAPIRSDDHDALVKLYDKVDRLEAQQRLMKAANKICRRKKGEVDEKLEELQELGLSERQAQELMKPAWNGKIGFLPWQLSNNNANIRSTKKRIGTLERIIAEGERVAEESEDGSAVQEFKANNIIYREDFDDMRVRLIFPDKPDYETRRQLKGRGFKWSRYNEAWQRLLNDNGRYAAKYLFEQFTGEKVPF